jgi:hypothetical protein
MWAIWSSVYLDESYEMMNKRSLDSANRSQTLSMCNSHLVRVGLENLDNLPSAVVPNGLPASVLLVPSGRGGRVRLEPFFQFLLAFHVQS